MHNQRPSRIVRVARRLPPMPGGKEIHVAELTKIQCQRGSQILLVYEMGDATIPGCASFRVLLPRFLPTRGFLGELLWSCFAIRTVKHQLDNSDLLHIHGDIGNLPIPLALRAKPVLLTLHGSINLRYKWLYRLLIRIVTYALCIGDETQRQLLSCGVEPEKLQPTSSGIRSQVFDTHAPDPAPISNRDLKIISVGTLSTQKNHALIIDAAGEMMSTIPCRVKVIGSGPTKKELIEHALRRNVKLELVEAASAEEVAQALRESNVFVLPSKRFRSMGEGLSTALLEALAVGVPCCVSTEALPTSAIIGSECYISFNPSSSTDLANGLREVSQGGVRIRSMVLAGSEAARERSWDAVTSEVEDAMMRVMSRVSTDHR